MVVCIVDNAEIDDFVSKLHSFYSGTSMTLRSIPYFVSRLCNGVSEI